MSNAYLFTSESVSEGHPDKVADQISDAVLDSMLKQDRRARVACETLIKTGLVVIAGEVTTSAWVDLEELVRKTILRIGYNSSEMGFDGATCAVLNAIGKQSADIAMGVDRESEKAQGAGDQGLMFGYASNETDVLMPAPITLAHRLVKRQADTRRSGKLPWLRPDAKSQITLRYEDFKPVGIDAVVLSTQHHPDVTQEALREGVMEEIVKPVLPTEWIDRSTRFHINPTGRFVIGGPVGDCGVTGRKIIVDTYGGMEKDADELISDWARGDTEALAKTLVHDFDRFPDLYRSLIVDRNRKWADEIGALLDDDQNYLIVVGALHLVGDDSVIELLRTRGHPAKRQ